MKLVYSKTVNLVSMMALLCMLVLPYLVPATANATTGGGLNPDQGLGSEKSPTLVITKTDADRKGIAGVEFEITQTHKFDTKTKTFVELAPGEQPIVIKKETNSNPGQLGKIEFTKKDGLEVGRYIVKETKVPAGIVLNTNTFTVDIPQKTEGGTGWDYKVEINSKAEYVKAAVELTKVDDNQKALADAQFELYKKGANGAAEKIGGTYTTNEFGKIHVDGLSNGEYYFVETKAPAGYVLDITEVEFTVTKAGEVISKSLVNYEIPTITKDIEGAERFDVEPGTEYTYNLTLNLPANIDKYTEYVVTDTLDSRLTYADKWSVVGVNSENIKFTESETTEGQEVLTWTVNDLKALKGVKQIVISFEAKIKLDAVLAEGETGIPNDATLQFNNGLGGTGSVTTKEVIVNPTDVQGDEDEEEEGLKIIKVDADDNNVTLAGAEFKLTDKKGKVIKAKKGETFKVNGQSADVLEKLTTNENGEIVIEGLPEGTYYLHETKAPTYKDEDGKVQDYKMLTSPIEVSISSDKLTTVTVENSKSGWDLPQTGGLGTVLFTVTGLGLMLLALIVLKRRKNESTNV